MVGGCLYIGVLADVAVLIWCFSACFVCFKFGVFVKRLPWFVV